MVYAVVSSTLLLLLVIYAPFLQPFFGTVSLAWEHWRLILPLITIPGLVAEIMKWVVARKLSAPLSA